MSRSRYLNRELSWLEFNQRVLDEANDSVVPLLERLKFLSITSSNLDEFFMVLVGGLHLLAKKGIDRQDPSGRSPSHRLGAISKRVHQMTRQQYHCYSEELEGDLALAGIQRVRPHELSKEQSRYLELYFEDEVYSIVTPLAVDSKSDFPPIGGRVLHLGVRLKPDPNESGKPRFGVIPLGRSMNRFVTLPGTGGHRYILAEDVVAHFSGRLFPGELVVECFGFRITRNADSSIREDYAVDLLAEMQEVLYERSQGDCVRLEIEDGASRSLISFLMRSLKISEQDLYLIPGPLDLSAYVKLCDTKGFEGLRNEPWTPQPSPDIDPTVSIFRSIAQRDILIHHPYESFEPVARLLEEAAVDPDVRAIKQTLYRTSKNSPIVAALGRAAENGKYVTVVVELKARFDEARNIEWAKSLERAGVQVIYGVKGLKTHAKVCIIVRQEPQGLRRYLHFGTGNYNEQTARLYSDISYMTCDPDLGADASAFFNALTGYSQPQKYRKIETAPVRLRDKLLELIGGETQRRQQGQKASIIAKMNALTDPEIIDALYAASGAGVKIQLNVRGICCLQPGVADFSENIEVVSIVDRFLEHSRIYYFHQGGAEKVFISSADWMTRNLDRRVELLVPIEDLRCRERLIEILSFYFEDNVKARSLLPDGSYAKIEPEAKNDTFRSQQALYEQVCQTVKNITQSRRTVFEPHRPTKE